MEAKLTDRILTYCIAAVWLVNGLYCKVLNRVPRHQEIVGEILGHDHAYWLTKLIGFGEVILCAWVLSGLHRRLCTLLQVALVMGMNVLENMLVPEMLLWGKMNFVFASLFSVILLWKEFMLNPNKK